MKNKILSNAILLGCMLALMKCEIFAQQVPLAYSQFSNPGVFNPASAGSWDVHQLAVAHQQRSGGVDGAYRISDFLNVSSAQPRGNRKIGWGLRLANDIEYTKTRFDLCPAVAASVISTAHFKLGVGIEAGLQILGSNYRKVPIFHLGDPTLQNGNNVYLDAGAGLHAAWRLHWMDGECGIHTQQLPGNGLTTNPYAMRLVPNLVAYYGTRFEVAPNFRAGPQILFHNALLRDSLLVPKAQMDIGLQAEFKRQHLRCSASYRLQHAGLTAGMGLQVWERDTLEVVGRPYLGVDLVAMFYLPGRAAGLLPAAEIGFGLRIGRPGRIVFTVHDGGPIWLTKAALTKHTETYIAPGSGKGIISTLQEFDSSHVLIQYQIPDDSRQYAGENPIFEQDTLIAELGEVWEGFDNFVMNIVGEGVEACLSPDLAHEEHPEEMDSLKFLQSIELRADIRDDREAATKGVGIAYNGELNPPGHYGDTLRFSVVYDHQDSTVIIPPTNYYLTNFELAALKLYALRLRMEYELGKYYQRHHVNYQILREGAPRVDYVDPDDDETMFDGRPVVRTIMRKLRIESDHAKQEVNQNTIVNFQYKRFGTNERKPSLPPTRRGSGGGRRQPNPNRNRPTVLPPNAYTQDEAKSMNPAKEKTKRQKEEVKTLMNKY